jgi:glycosyltransferase involved in cell wall biosynthesis
VPERREQRVWCLPRTGRATAVLGRALRRPPYAVEQITFLPGIIRQIRRLRPDVLFYSDMNMAMRLFRWRDRIGVPYRMLYSNGAPLEPPFNEVDHVQQVVPQYYEQALSAGEPASKHSLVPYGITVPPGAPDTDPAARQSVRRKLGLPADRAIVLTVGAINDYHKRMDYTIREVAAMPAPRPYLVMLGAFEAETPRMLALADELLGRGNYIARSVPYAEVADYYRAADVFVLSSLKEGFGRVYLEALIHGLPTIGHDQVVMRYVLGDAGITADLSRPGELAATIARVLAAGGAESAAAGRRESVRRRFAWGRLAPQYAEMFRRCAGGGY